MTSLFAPLGMEEEGREIKVRVKDICVVGHIQITSWSGLLVDEVGSFLKMLFKLWMLFSRKQSKKKKTTKHI